MLDIIWISVAILVIILIFNFFISRNNIMSNITSNGGMAKKYGYLIERLTAHPSARIKKQGANDVLIVSEGRTTRISFYVMENFGAVDIEWLADYGPTGKIYKKWSFPESMTQQQMVEEIESYVIMRTSQLLSGGV